MFNVSLGLKIGLGWLLACSLAIAQSAAAPSSSNGSIKIAKLLWASNTKAAASTLAKSILVAIDRDQIEDLKGSLAQLEKQFESVVQNSEDPRFSVSLAANLLLHPRDEDLKSLRNLITTTNTSGDAELLAKVWFAIAAENAFESFVSQISNPQSSSLKNFSVLIQTAFSRDRVRTTDIVLEHWAKLPSELQLAAIEPMTAQPATMLKLVQAVQSGTVSKDLVNTNQIRKWQASNQEELKSAMSKTWGQVRDSDNAERQQLVREKLALLRKEDSKGSVARGQKVFQRVCSQCHQLHGVGIEVGPNIENNGRGNLEQLVSNVFDPSLVIGNAFQSRIVLTTEGEVIAGLVVADDERYLKLKTQGGKIVEFDKSADIDSVKISPKSLMPDGIEDQLSNQELLDLFALLCLVKAPNATDNATIPGTPENLINP